MYSCEISQTMEHYEYNIPSSVYLAITDNSPQIAKVIYHTWDGRFEICDKEGACWNFAVYFEAA